MTVVSKADIHNHTTCSDGLMTPEALVEYAATKTDLRVIAVTDHNTTEGGQIARAYRDAFALDFAHLEVIVGQEVMSRDGDILALFIEQDIPGQLSAAESIERIHAQGGLAIAAHPYAFVVTRFGGGGMEGVKGLIHRLPFDGVEERNGTPTELLSNLWTRLRNRGVARHSPTGGSDTHYLPTVGSTYTCFPGKSAADLRRAIEAGQTRAGGHVYSPLTILRVISDRKAGRLPDNTLAPEHRELWQGEVIGADL